MTHKRLLRTTSAQLIYQAALAQGLDVKIESTRFNLFSMRINKEKIFVKGTNLPLNLQSSCLIAGNKYLSKKIFRQHGILTPKSWLVSSVPKARNLIISKNIFPCVLKPIFGAHGNEVYANIETSGELEAVLADFSKKPHQNILIEEHIQGVDYRILVVGKNVSAIIERTPAHVIGDGTSTIKELISIFNKQPLVGIKFEKPLCKIHIDFELARTLKKSSLTLSSIVQKGTLVFLKQNANISSGGISTNVTQTVNKNSKTLAINAAQSLGMEFCGVDVIYDHSTRKSYVLEVNDCPGIDIHHYPVVGAAQDVAGDIMKYIVEKYGEKARPTHLARKLARLDLHIPKHVD